MHFKSVAVEKKPSIVYVHDNELQNPIETPKSSTTNSDLFFKVIIFAVCIMEFGFVVVSGYSLYVSTVTLNTGSIWIETNNHIKIDMLGMIEFLYTGIIFGIFLYFLLQFARLFAGIQLESPGILKKWIKSRVSLTIFFCWICGLLFYYSVGYESKIIFVVSVYILYFLASAFVMTVIKKRSKSTTGSASLD